MKITSERIRVARAKRRHSVAEAAREIGIDTRTLYRWEADDGDPTAYIRELQRVLEKLQIYVRES